MLTKPERVAFARCWGLWRRWLAWERNAREMSRPSPNRAVLYRLCRAIREEMRDG